MDQHRTCDKAPSGKRGGQADRQAGFAGCGIAATWRLRVYLKVCQDVTLLHGYANPLKRLDTSESVNLHKCLILLDSCQIHATRWDIATNRTEPATLPRHTGQGARVCGLGKPGRAAEIESKGASGVAAQPARKRLTLGALSRCTPKGLAKIGDLGE